MLGTDHLITRFYFPEPEKKIDAKQKPDFLNKNFRKIFLLTAGSDYYHYFFFIFHVLYTIHVFNKARTRYFYTLTMVIDTS